MKSDKHFNGSGKTFFTSQKSPGQSWIALRDEAIKNGNWAIKNEQRGEKSTEDRAIHDQRAADNSAKTPEGKKDKENRLD